MPFREGESIGGHFTYLNLGDQVSTDANGNELGSFSSYMYALNLSYAKQIDETSSWGVNGKYFYQELAVINSLDASSGSFCMVLVLSTFFSFSFVLGGNPCSFLLLASPIFLKILTLLIMTFLQLYFYFLKDR